MEADATGLLDTSGQSSDNSGNVVVLESDDETARRYWSVAMRAARRDEDLAAAGFESMWRNRTRINGSEALAFTIAKRAASNARRSEDRHRKRVESLRYGAKPVVDAIRPKRKRKGDTAMKSVLDKQIRTTCSQLAEAKAGHKTYLRGGLDFLQAARRQCSGRFLPVNTPHVSYTSTRRIEREQP